MMRRPDQETDPKILVIDDEAPIRTLCRVNLEEHGFEVVEAAEGRTGIEAAQRESPDLILLNVNMPGLDGWQVAERLLKAEPTRDIPIVFLTARTDFRDRVKGLDLGAVDYITKPFDPLDLGPRLRTLLERIAGAER